MQQLLRRYPDDRDSLARAHAILRDGAIYMPAMHRVARSLHQGRFSAVISCIPGRLRQVAQPASSPSATRAWYSRSSRLITIRLS